MGVITKMDAMTAVDAAVRLPYSVPNMPVNSLIPTGDVFTFARGDVRANKNSFQQRIMLRIAPVAMPGIARGKIILLITPGYVAGGDCRIAHQVHRLTVLMSAYRSPAVKPLGATSSMRRRSSAVTVTSTAARFSSK